MSEVKVNKISPRSGTTVTLGDSGDTFTIPSGATINNQGTAVNFGATGSASWVTTVKTSSPFTAVAGEGYFVNTTGGAITVNLPAGTPGAVVAIKDYAGTFDTNAVTLVQNGSDKIGGSTVNATLDAEGIAVTLVFIDSTQGWLVTDSGLQSESPTAEYVTASSPCVATVGDYKIHTFTGGGPFNVTNSGNAAGSNTVDYLVVGGGGGGGSGDGGGGGAGGYRESSGAASGCYSASPLGAGVTGLAVPVQNYTITVGGGGTGTATPNPNTGGNRGDVSTFSTITAAGGGGGAGGGACSSPYTPGGSGGGARRDGNGQGGGTGNVPIVSPPQGKDGGTPNAFPGPSGWNGAGGGGGATVAGSGGTGNTPASERAGNGGNGATSSINNTPTARAGGGGGGAEGNSPNCFGTGGTGGGGAGFNPGRSNAAGTVNTGGGGGGRANPGTGSTGGSGIVIIRYKFQN